MLANPFYAIQIHPSHGRRHLHPMSEAQWITSNERAVAELGRKGWLLCLLDALKSDHRGREPWGPFEIGDPYPAITTHQTLCLEHEPVVDEAAWVRTSVIGLQESEQVWMSNLLSVLKGAFVGENPYGYRTA